MYAEVIDALRAARVTPTVREADADTADAVARTLVNCGLTAFEFTATTPGWEDLVAAWVKEFPEVTLGLGTVTSPEIAERALAAGANFLVSPFQVPEVRPVADAAGGSSSRAVSPRASCASRRTGASPSCSPRTPEASPT